MDQNADTLLRHQQDQREQYTAERMLSTLKQHFPDCKPVLRLPHGCGCRLWLPVANSGFQCLFCMPPLKMIEAGIRDLVAPLATTLAQHQAAQHEEYLAALQRSGIDKEKP